MSQQSRPTMSMTEGLEKGTEPRIKLCRARAVKDKRARTGDQACRASSNGANVMNRPTKQDDESQVKRIRFHDR